MKFILFFTLFALVACEDFKTHQIHLKVLDSTDEFVYRGNDSEPSTTTTSAPRRFPKVQMKISLGHQANERQFPFVAELAINTKTAGILCTGSLIAPNWILTARHCIADVDAETVLAQLGSADRLSPQRVKIFANTFIFMTASMGRSPDISLFKLVSDAPLKSNIYTVRLPSLAQKNEKFEGQTVTAIGWGGVGGGRFSQFLQYTTFTVLPESDCYLAASVICSQPRTGSSSVEGGDSGGPLILYEDNIPTLVGVNVFTAKSGTNVWQGATRITDFLSFISDSTGIVLRNN